MLYETLALPVQDKKLLNHSICLLFGIGVEKKIKCCVHKSLTTVRAEHH